MNNIKNSFIINKIIFYTSFYFQYSHLPAMEPPSLKDLAAQTILRLNLPHQNIPLEGEEIIENNISIQLNNIFNCYSRAEKADNKERKAACIKFLIDSNQPGYSKIIFKKYDTPPFSIEELLKENDQKILKLVPANMERMHFELSLKLSETLRERANKNRSKFKMYEKLGSAKDVLCFCSLAAIVFYGGLPVEAINPVL